MRKYIKFLYIVLAVSFVLCGCSNMENNNEKIIGYWMNKNADTISFTDETNCSINNNACSYTIYDDNHLQITSFDKKTHEYLFKFENGNLYIKGINSQSFDEFTKDEFEQAEIIKQVEFEKQEANAEKQKQEKIAQLKEDIQEYQNEINWSTRVISNNEKDIKKWEQDTLDTIKDCEEAIASGDDREYHENQRDDFIQANNEAIEGCKKRIAEHKEKIEMYKNEIVKIQEQIDLLNNN